MNRKQKIALGIIAGLIILIPAGSLAVSAALKIGANTNKSDTTEVNFTPLPVTSAREIPKGKPGDALLQQTPNPTPANETQGFAAPLIGSTLSFKIASEARPQGKQATKLFIGLSEGAATTNPKYILSFVLNIPDDGSYKGLSLAGLDQGKKYTAYLKGEAQIATSSGFAVLPTPIDLGSLSMLTGDVNEDNKIDDADYGIVKSALGTRSTSSNWNPNLDFNLDGVVNSLDLGIITRNLGKIGASGAWYSSTNPVKIASSSGSLLNTASQGGELQTDRPTNVPPTTQGGYWMWFPAP